MLSIRPVTDLRYKFTEIYNIIHESLEPVFLTKNGRGDLVLMSMQTYEELLKGSMPAKLAGEAKNAKPLPDNKPPGGKNRQAAAKPGYPKNRPGRH